MIVSLSKGQVPNSWLSKGKLFQIMWINIAVSNKNSRSYWGYCTTLGIANNLNNKEHIRFETDSHHARDGIFGVFRPPFSFSRFAQGIAYHTDDLFSKEISLAHRISCLNTGIQLVRFIRVSRDSLSRYQLKCDFTRWT